MHVQIVRCRCGVRRNSRPTVGGADTAELRQHAYVKRYQDSEPITRGFYRDLLRELSLPSGARLLEVGCSIGLGLDEAHRLGLRPTGVEPDTDARRLAQALGHPVVASIEPLAGQAFDGFVLNHVLEHVSEPVTLLRRLRALARPQARLFIGVPSGNALWALVQRSRWCFLSLDEHLWFFAPRQLQRIARTTGWRVERLETHSRRYPPGLGGQLRNLALTTADRLGRGECVNLVASAT